MIDIDCYRPQILLESKICKLFANNPLDMASKSVPVFTLSDQNG